MSKYKFVKRKYDDNLSMEDIALKFYKKCGVIFIVCGILFFALIVFIELLPVPKNDIHDITLFNGLVILFTAVPIILGAIILFLCDRSIRFRAYISKDMKSFLTRLIQKKRRE